jgi:hypothetical protein
MFMKKIILGLPVIAFLAFSCSDRQGEETPAMPIDTIKTVPPVTDPMDTITQGHYRYETTDKPGTEPDSQPGTGTGDSAR